MGKNEVVVVAYVSAKAGLETQVKEELLALIEPTRKEDGCIGYYLHHDVENKGRFMFYEIWRSMEDINAHFQTPHITNIVGKSDRLFDEPVKITMWKKLDT
ncbi:MAG: antibiotic biosynthesis monooxygenase [Nitrospirae bacterium]|nr:antibiotic biosynthesis monooxygenase [Nitrospirota bacterium]